MKKLGFLLFIMRKVWSFWIFVGYPQESSDFYFTSVRIFGLVLNFFFFPFFDDCFVLCMVLCLIGNMGCNSGF